MKDLFSAQGQLYQQARPTYPQAVVQELLKHVPAYDFAWDCGAGSGQFTQLLAPYFEQIVATDLSANQLQHAPYFENV
ncbi:MAG TPA: SAM-dependent methyltransferase, partial [Acinetobacter ursingii]|nr:SAM-dependent methyltransferase [Acinetobacter ursingii]